MFKLSAGIFGAAALVLGLGAGQAAAETPRAPIADILELTDEKWEQRQADNALAVEFCDQVNAGIIAKLEEAGIDYATAEVRHDALTGAFCDVVVSWPLLTWAKFYGAALPDWKDDHTISDSSYDDAAQFIIDNLHPGHQDAALKLEF